LQRQDQGRISLNGGAFLLTASRRASFSPRFDGGSADERSQLFAEERHRVEVVVDEHGATASMRAPVDEPVGDRIGMHNVPFRPDQARPCHVMPVGRLSEKTN
jgi:hypothetical protein